MKTNSLVALALFTCLNVTAKDKQATLANLDQRRNLLSFTENKGQVTDQYHNRRNDIQFSVKAASELNIFVGNGGIHYQFTRAQAAKQDAQASASIPNFRKEIPKTTPIDMYRMDVELQGVNKSAAITTEEKQNNYECFTNAGIDGKSAAVYTYERITYKDIYPHIDWVLYMKNGQMKHEFVINEGGKASDIRLKYSGATNLQLNANGSLTATTPLGTITEQAPIFYQANGKEVAGSFKLDDNVLTYIIGNFTGQLVIDPTLQWATYFGGSGNDAAADMATDGAGNIYITGYTSSLSAIATTGAYNIIYDGGVYDAFLAKFSSEGVIQWSTYYGGNNDDEGSGIAIDASNNIFITGKTGSTSGIATTGAYQTTEADTGAYPGGLAYGDAFLAKFGSDGNLQWGTYFGSTGPDEATKVAIDGSGNAYITGLTYSAGGITTPGVYQTTFIPDAGGSFDGDAFLAKFSATGTRLWATYFGGSGIEIGINVTTDGPGNVYITGLTNSNTGVATTGAYQTVQGDGGMSFDAFLAKFNSTGSILWSTYYGGGGEDVALDVTKDTANNIYITGFTASMSGISTPGAYQTFYGGGPFDCFLAKLNNAGAMQWSTYYGGSGIDNASALATDTSGNIYMTGMTASTNSIATAGATQPFEADGGMSSDAFLANFNSAGAIQWATYSGGAQSDYGNAVTADGAGHVYIAGQTNSDEGIATFGAYQPSFADSTDGFVARFNFCASPAISIITGATSICPDSVTVFTDSTAGGAWNISNNKATITPGGMVTGVTNGIDTIVYRTINTCGTATVLKPLIIGTYAGTLSGISSFCNGSTTTLSGSETGGTWNATNSNATVSAAGVVTGVQAGTDTIVYTITGPCGSATTTKVITINPLPEAGTITGPDSACIAGSAIFSDTASGGLWGMTNTIASISFTGTVSGFIPGTDTIIYIVSNDCGTDTAEKTIRIVNCETGVMNIASSTQAITVYPNPTQNSITVSSGEKTGKVTINNLTGQEVYIGTYNTGEIVISMEQLPSGVYILKVNDSKVVKVVKE